MAKRSTASLQVVQIGVRQKVRPPRDLSRQERVLWREIVATKPADWFDADSLPLLKGYVRAAAMADVLDAEIKNAAGDNRAALLQIRDREERRAAMLATKMRLTQQSRYDEKHASVKNKRAGMSRPWERVGT